jgi:hypothetical protein
MANQKEPDYPGVLWEPLPRPPKRPKQNAQVDDPARRRWDAFCDKLYWRFLLLFRHFGIDPDASDSWSCLAIALARRHVPGFQTALKKGARQPVGRPTILGTPEAEQARADLLAKVEELQQKPRSKSESASLDYLISHPRTWPKLYIDMSGSRPSVKVKKSTLKQHLAIARRERDRRNARSGAIAKLVNAAVQWGWHDPIYHQIYQELESIKQEINELARERARAQFPFGGLIALGDAVLPASRTATPNKKPGT